MVERTDVVTVFIEKNGTIFVARRSEQVRTYMGRWAGISGYLETEDPVDQAYEELREETGLTPDQVDLVATGDSLEGDDGERHWRIHPFRFKISEDVAIELDREHTEFRWINPDRLDQLDTVPSLRETWENVS